MQKEKGNAIVLILVIVLLIGFLVGIYLVGQKTNLLPKAYSPVPTKTAENLIQQSQYQNPFAETSPTPGSGNTNIFSGYQNPFENLK